MNSPSRIDLLLAEGSDVGDEVLYFGILEGVVPRLHVAAESRWRLPPFLITLNSVSSDSLAIRAQSVKSRGLVASVAAPLPSPLPPSPWHLAQKCLVVTLRGGLRRRDAGANAHAIIAHAPTSSDRLHSSHRFLPSLLTRTEFPSQRPALRYSRIARASLAGRFRQRPHVHHDLVPLVRRLLRSRARVMTWLQ